VAELVEVLVPVVVALTVLVVEADTVPVPELEGAADTDG
jgi:hypothetical protein